MEKYRINLLELAILLLIFFSCNNIVDNEESKIVYHPLPLEFPLKVGKAWVYKTYLYDYQTYYWDATIDSSKVDTLFITGKNEEFYYYSWDPQNYFSLVCNKDDKLLNFGQIDFNHGNIDTTYFEKPIIWTIFNIDSGSVNLDYFKKKYEVIYDSITVSILDTIVFKEEFYCSYVFNEKNIERPELDRIQYCSELGFSKWAYLDEKKNIVKEKRLIQIIDSLPLNLSKNNNEISLKKNYYLPDDF